MAVVYENYEHLEPIPFIYGFVWILSSVIFFQTLNEFLKRSYHVSKATPGIEGDAKAGVKEGDDLWKWRNLLISWIHAVIVGTWDLSCFYRYPEITTDLIAFHNTYMYAMVAVSTGYFIHDFIDIIVSNHLKDTWEVLPHHIAVAGMFFYNIVECRCIAFNVVALLAEVNTIFLHSRKLLQMCDFSFTHWLYRVNSGMNLFTFVSCRFLCLTWIVYGMFIWYDRVSLVYLVVLGSSMLVMWVINVVLFWRLLCSDVLRPLQKSRRSRKAAAALSSAETTAAAANNHHKSRQNGNSNNNKAINGVVTKVD